MERLQTRAIAFAIFNLVCTTTLLSCGPVKEIFRSDDHISAAVSTQPAPEKTQSGDANSEKIGSASGSPIPDRTTVAIGDDSENAASRDVLVKNWKGKSFQISTGYSDYCVSIADDGSQCNVVYGDSYQRSSKSGVCSFSISPYSPDYVSLKCRTTEGFSCTESGDLVSSLTATKVIEGTETKLSDKNGKEVWEIISDPNCKNFLSSTGAGRIAALSALWENKILHITDGSGKITKCIQYSEKENSCLVTTISYDGSRDKRSGTCSLDGKVGFSLNCKTSTGATCSSSAFDETLLYISPPQAVAGTEASLFDKSDLKRGVSIDSACQ